jgi:hypothetical protein
MVNNNYGGKVMSIFFKPLGIFAFITIFCSISWAAPPYATNIEKYVDFNNIPVTGENEVPTGGGGWIYSSDKTNPGAECKISTYDNAGWCTFRNGDWDKIYISDASTRRVWGNYHYVSVSNDCSINSHCMEQVITGGMRDETKSQDCGLELANKQDYLDYLDAGKEPICKDNSFMVGEGYIYLANLKETDWSVSQGANRMSVYVKAPSYFKNGQDDDDFPARIMNIGPYSITGGHYYHYYYAEPTDGWVHLQVDTHPQHNNSFKMRNHSGYDGTKYFDEMYRMYIRVWSEAKDSLDWKGSGIAPWSVKYDGFEFWYDSEPQNDQTINSLAVAYSPSRKRFNIGFNDKYWDWDTTATYEIKYSFSPITNANYESAKYVQVVSDDRYGIPSSNKGRISKVSNYRPVVWCAFGLQLTDAASLDTEDWIYFAVKDITGRDYSGTYSEYSSEDQEIHEINGIGYMKEINLIKRIDYYLGKKEDVSPDTPLAPRDLQIVR